MPAAGGVDGVCGGIALPLAAAAPAPAAAGHRAAAIAAPFGLAIAVPRSKKRDAAVYALQMWAYIVLHELPYDDPARLERRVRVDYPIAVDRALLRALARPPSCSARWPAGTAPRALDHALVYAHWAWFVQPHAAAAYILWRHPQRFPRSAVLICAVFDLGLAGYFLVPTAPPWWAAEHGRIQGMRRIMVDVGQQVWGRLWSPLYGFLGGNPLAAMPSLHFATSLMAAHVLSEARPGGRGGWDGPMRARSASRSSTSASTTSWTCSRAPRSTEGIRAAGPRAAPALSAVVRTVAGARAQGSVVKAFRPDDRAPAAAPRPQDLDADRVAERARYEEPVTEEVESRMTFDRRRLITYALVVLVILVALYFVLPKLTGLEDSLRKIEDADPVWIAVALGLNLLSFAAYIALFRGILGGRRCRRSCASASTGAPRTRSRSPGWRPRGCSRPAAPAASRSPTGRCAARAWRRGRRRAGWSPSSCCSTPCTCWRSWSAASSCGSACSPARARSG